MPFASSGVHFLSLFITETRTSYPSDTIICLLAPSPNCKHSLIPCLQLWSLTLLLHGRCSPTDVSAFLSPPGCFLAEWSRSRSVSSGDRDQGHLLWDKSLTNTLLGKLSWLLAIYSAHLSAIGWGQLVNCNAKIKWYWQKCVQHPLSILYISFFPKLDFRRI